MEQRERQRRYNELHRKEINEKQRKRRELHREEVNEIQRKYRELHREELNQKAREYRRRINEQHYKDIIEETKLMKEYRSKGKSYQWIADKMGYSVATIRNRVLGACNESEVKE